MASWTAGSWCAYALSTMLGVLGFGICSVVLARCFAKHPRLGLGAAIAFCMSCGAAVCLSGGYYAEFGEYPSWSEAAFLIEEVRNARETIGLVQASLTPQLVALTMGTMLLAAAWVRVVPFRYRFELSEMGRRARVVLLAATPLALGGRLLVPGLAVASPPFVNEVVNVGLLAKYYQTRTRGRFHPAVRAEVPRAPQRDFRPNVLLIVQESLSRNRMSVFGYERPTTPELDKLHAARAEELFLFERALSNSSNTSVSLPTILLGLSPDADVDAFHRAPASWHYARAAGYRTFLLSAQSFRYANLDSFLLTSPPDYHWTPGEDIELSNGGGMDDELFAERVEATLDQFARQTGPFFGVVQFNATHHPFLERPPLSPEFDVSTRIGRYENAVALLDRILVRLFHHLEQLGVDQDTVVLMTADHGESHGEHQVHRTHSFYEEVLGIPFFVLLPRAQQSRLPYELGPLRDNRELRVQNLDVVPTLLDLFGIPEDGDFAPLRAQLPGQSLFREIPRDRVIVARNVVPIRAWSDAGFGLVRDAERYIFTEWRGEEYFDLRTDPEERNNRLLTEPLPDWVTDTLTRRPDLAALREQLLRPSRVSRR